MFYEGKWFSFFVARYKGSQMKVFRFQVEHLQIVHHEQIATLEASFDLDFL